MNTTFSKQEMLDELDGLVGAFSDHLQKIYGYHAVNRLLAEDVTVAGMKSPLNGPRRQVPIVSQFEVLYGYAMNAEWDLSAPFQDREALVKDAAAFVTYAVAAHQALFDEEPDHARCLYIVESASARQKLDEFKSEGWASPLALKELGLLAHMSEQAVRNSISSGELVADQNFRSAIDPQVALPWLQGRRHYRPTIESDSLADIAPTVVDSINDLVSFICGCCEEVGITAAEFEQQVGWKPDFYRGANLYQLMREGGVFDLSEWKIVSKLLHINERWLVTTAVNLMIADPDARSDILCSHRLSIETVVVPVAGDGSMFLPEARTRNGYRVGKKGDECLYANYWEALSSLKQLPTPYWRRPSAATGRMGIVKGISWKDVEKDQIQKMLDRQIG